MVKRRVRWDRVCTAIIGGAIAVTLLTGFYDGGQKLVQTIYTVKEGDTLRGISEMFLPLNTGGRRYLRRASWSLIPSFTATVAISIPASR